MYTLWFFEHEIITPPPIFLGFILLQINQKFQTFDVFHTTVFQTALLGQGFSL